MKLRTLSSLLVGALLSLAPQKTYADYMLARRIPTGKQALNITKVENEPSHNLTTLTNTLLFKYYTPDTGIILGVPAVYRTTPQGTAQGLGDVVLRLTHIFDPVESLGVAPYTVTKFPSGAYDTNRKVNPGTGTFAQTFGVDMTYNRGRLELDATFAYVATMPNPRTGVNPGDIVYGSLSLAYAKVGTLWAGLEVAVQRQWSAQKFEQQILPGQESIALGPETRFSLGNGVLMHAGIKVATNNAQMAEVRMFYNF